jgi:hypothetical protein
MTHSISSTTSQVSIHSGRTAENDSTDAATEKVTYKSKTLTKKIKSKIAGLARKFTRSVRKTKTAAEMKFQQAKNRFEPVQLQGNPLYDRLPKATPAAPTPAPAPTTIHIAAAATEIYKQPETIVAETPPIETVPSQIIVSEAPPALRGKWQIEDIDLELATMPTSRAEQAPMAKETRVTPTVSESKQAAAPYVKAELDAPAFKKFQTQDAKARDLLRLKHDDLFPLALEQLDKAYDTAYAKAFAERYAAARQDGLAETASLKFAGAMAAETVLVDFLVSSDPARNSYATAIGKFKQEIVDTTSVLTGKKSTSIVYKLRTELAPQKPIRLTTTIKNHVRDEAAAREVMRADNGDTFIAAGISPDSTIMRKLSLSYDAAYKLAFEKQFAESIQQGQPASQALAGAKAIATSNASLSFTLSGDPLRIAYAKVMRELEADENIHAKAPEINWATHPDMHKSPTTVAADN